MNVQPRNSVNAVRRSIAIRPYADYSLTFFYAPQLSQLYRQVLLRRVLAVGILSVCLSVCHDTVVYQAQVR